MKSPALKIVLGAVAILLALAMVALPNLLRSRMTADPASPAAAGVWYVCTINTSQVMYFTTYEKVGYAPNLAVLGPAENGQCNPEHACLLDSVIACPQGTDQEWCTKGLYRYNVQSSSTEPPYKDYWVTATPIKASPNLKNYCSTEDAVIRIESGTPLKRPYTRDECLAVPPDPNGYHP